MIPPVNRHSVSSATHPEFDPTERQNIVSASHTEKSMHSSGGGRMPIANALMLMLLVPAGLLLPSCNIVGPIAYLAAGPGQIDAEHELVDRPTIVFVDDRANMLPRRSLRIVLGDSCATRLMEQEVVLQENMISTRDAIAAASGEQSGALRSVADIGEATEAAQVIYVEITGFTHSIDNARPLPAIACSVSVVDVATRTLLYPDAGESGAQHRDLLIQSPREYPSEAYRSGATRRQVEEEIAAFTGEQIAKLFYKHERSSGSGSRVSN